MVPADPEITRTVRDQGKQPSVSPFPRSHPPQTGHSPRGKMQHRLGAVHRVTTFRFGTREKHVREALTAAFSKRGVDLANLDPSIQSTMVAAALSTGAEERLSVSLGWQR